jgi:hypothetical protein
MRLNTVVAKVHIYAGLQASVGLLISALAVFVVVLDFEEEVEISYGQYTGAMLAGKLDLAKALHQQFGHRFEKVPQSWMLPASSGQRLHLRYYSANGTRDLYLDRRSGKVEIHSKPANLAQFLNGMHQESVGRRHSTDSPWMWAWSYYIELTVLSLFLFPITGAYMGLAARRSRRLAIWSLVFSTTAMTILWVWIR